MTKYSIFITFITTVASTANAQLTHGEAFEEASAAAAEGRIDSLKLLFSSYNFDYVELNRLLEAAASHGNLQSMKALLDRGVRIDVDDEDEDPTVSPLMSASFFGHADAVRFLLSRGANAKRALNSERHIFVSMKDSLREISEFDGWTAYDFAKAAGHTNVMAIEGMYVPSQQIKRQKDLVAPQYPTFRTSPKAQAFMDELYVTFAFGALSAYVCRFLITGQGHALLKYFPKATRML